jgi:hypothetical protein
MLFQHPMPKLSGNNLSPPAKAQNGEIEVGVNGMFGVAHRRNERRICTDLSFMGFINESPLYAFPPTPSFTVSAPELSVDPCLAPCSLRTMSPAIPCKGCDPGDPWCPQLPAGMGERSESAGEEARPATDIKAVEKAAELQHQRAALPSQKCCCKHTKGVADLWFVLVER